MTQRLKNGTSISHCDNTVSDFDMETTLVMSQGKDCINGGGGNNTDNMQSGPTSSTGRESSNDGCGDIDVDVDITDEGPCEDGIGQRDTEGINKDRADSRELDDSDMDDIQIISEKRYDFNCDHPSGASECNTAATASSVSNIQPSITSLSSYLVNINESVSVTANQNDAAAAICTNGNNFNNNGIRYKPFGLNSSANHSSILKSSSADVVSTAVNSAIISTKSGSTYPSSQPSSYGKLFNQIHGKTSSNNINSNNSVYTLLRSASGPGKSCTHIASSVTDKQQPAYSANASSEVKNTLQRHILSKRFSANAAFNISSKHQQQQQQQQLHPQGQGGGGGSSSAAAKSLLQPSSNYLHPNSAASSMFPHPHHQSPFSPFSFPSSNGTSPPSSDCLESLEQQRMTSEALYVKRCLTLSNSFGATATHASPTTVQPNQCKEPLRKTYSEPNLEMVRNKMKLHAPNESPVAEQEPANNAALNAHLDSNSVLHRNISPCKSTPVAFLNAESLLAMCASGSGHGQSAAFSHLAPTQKNLFHSAQHVATKRSSVDHLLHPPSAKSKTMPLIGSGGGCATNSQLQDFGHRSAPSTVNFTEKNTNTFTMFRSEARDSPMSTNSDYHMPLRIRLSDENNSSSGRISPQLVNNKTEPSLVSHHNLSTGGSLLHRQAHAAAALPQHQFHQGISKSSSFHGTILDPKSSPRYRLTSPTSSQFSPNNTVATLSAILSAAHSSQTSPTNSPSNHLKLNPPNPIHHQQQQAQLNSSLTHSAMPLTFPANANAAVTLPSAFISHTSTLASQALDHHHQALSQIDNSSSSNAIANAAALAAAAQFRSTPTEFLAHLGSIVNAAAAATEREQQQQQQQSVLAAAAVLSQLQHQQQQTLPPSLYRHFSADSSLSSFQAAVNSASSHGANSNGPSSNAHPPLRRILGPGVPQQQNLPDVPPMPALLPFGAAPQPSNNLKQATNSSDLTAPTMDTIPSTQLNENATAAEISQRQSEYTQLFNYYYYAYSNAAALNAARNAAASMEASTTNDTSKQYTANKDMSSILPSVLVPPKFVFEPPPPTPQFADMQLSNHDSASSMENQNQPQIVRKTSSGESSSGSFPRNSSSDTVSHLKGPGVQALQAKLQHKKKKAKQQPFLRQHLDSSSSESSSTAAASSAMDLIRSNSGGSSGSTTSCGNNEGRSGSGSGSAVSIKCNNAISSTAENKLSSHQSVFGSECDTGKPVNSFSFSLITNDSEMTEADHNCGDDYKAATTSSLSSNIQPSTLINSANMSPPHNLNNEDVNVKPSVVLKKHQIFMMHSLQNSKNGRNDEKMTVENYLGPIPKRTGLGYNPIMLKHCCSCNNVDAHVESPIRLQYVWMKLLELDIPKHCKVMLGRETLASEIELVHSPKYVEAFSASNKQLVEELDSQLSTLSCGGRGIDMDLIWNSEESPQACLTAVGVLLELVEKVARSQLNNGFALIRPPGQHAESSQPLGFSVFNNVAIAAKTLLAKNLATKMLIINWDVHHGNGTEKIFEDNPNVLYISVHRYDDGSFFPGSGSPNVTGSNGAQGTTINIGFTSSAEVPMADEDYMAAFRSVVVPFSQKFNPDIVLVSAGFDAARGHSRKLGGYIVSPECFGWMTKQVLSLADGKVVLCLEDGFELKETTDSIVACLYQLLRASTPSNHTVVSNNNRDSFIHRLHPPLVKKTSLEALPSPEAIKSIEATLLAHIHYWPKELIDFARNQLHISQSEADKLSNQNMAKSSSLDISSSSCFNSSESHNSAKIANQDILSQNKSTFYENNDSRGISLVNIKREPDFGDEKVQTRLNRREGGSPVDCCYMEQN